MLRSTRSRHVVRCVGLASLFLVAGTAFSHDLLKEEGLTQVIDARTKSGEADKPARERYTNEVR